MLVIYRVCEKEVNSPKRPERPEWFDKRCCFVSLYNSFKRLKNVKSNSKLVIIWDGPAEVLNEFIRFTVESDVAIVYANTSGNRESLLRSYIYAAEHSSDSYYFVEDDYLHTLDALEVLQEGVEAFGLCSVYDHPDRYTRNDDLTKGQEEIKLTKSSHWRTAESTTCTWGVSKEMFEKVSSLALDAGIGDRGLFRTLYHRGIRLYTSIPGRSTHLHKDLLSPFLDPSVWNILETGDF